MSKTYGNIIELNGRDFLETFIEKEIHDNFQYLLVSTDIETVGEYKNVMKMPQLIPNAMIMEYFMSKEKKMYKFEYNNFLRREEIRAIITTIMSAAVNNKFDIILLCSEEEDEYGYVKMIRKFIETEYNFPTYSYKKFCKARDTKSFIEVEDIEKVKDQVVLEVERIKQLNISLGVDGDKITKAKDMINDMSKKKMVKFCKAKGYKKYKDLEEKELRKYIIKKIEKESGK